MSTKEDLKNKIKRAKPTAADELINVYDKKNNIDNNNNDIYDNGVVDGDNNNTDDNANVDDYFKQLATGSKPKKKNKVFTSFYMDPDLAPIVDKLAKRGGRGEKSRLINNAIRKTLSEYGLLDQ